MFGKGVSINLVLGAAICWKSVRRGNTSRELQMGRRDDRGKAEKRRRRKKQDGSRRVLKGKIYSGCLSNAISNAGYTLKIVKRAFFLFWITILLAKFSSCFRFSRKQPFTWSRLEFDQKLQMLQYWRKKLKNGGMNKNLKFRRSYFTSYFFHH